MRVITIGAEDDPASAPIVKYAKDIASELRGQMVRVSTDFGNNPINSDKSRAGSDESRAGAKIQDAEQLRVHTMLIIGGATCRRTQNPFAFTAKVRKARS